MSQLCNQCECVNINGVRCHEGGCPNQYEQIKLGDDGTLDTVFFCDACKEEFRFNFQSTDPDPDIDTEDEDAYESFKLDCLRELQDTHECEEAYDAEEDPDDMEDNDEDEEF